MVKEMIEVTCNKCGKVHFLIKGDGKSDAYKKCTACGNSYKDFRPAVEADAPAGCTINPILDPSE